ncbi:peroxidase-related enzyme [Roseivirga sp. E12]|uniref:peroxidase-related enzyme n=1 Tax=Roseivirga sp. E12 TaxID=2819237 RepID=UPI001ABC839F|nr:peroxidase-related enzyme [Roseivirga sp. E12]MBO3700451.1 peroxidase-related enzyme [Roseivirga sp. E12]
MAFIKVIEHQEAEGELKEVYDHLLETRGKLAEVHKIQSLNPRSIMNHMDLYMTIMFGKSPLKRYQREMIAVVVSAANDCEYCQVHHGAALNHFWKNEEKVNQLWHDYKSVELSEVDAILCGYAFNLTVNPGRVKEEDFVGPLKALGLEERAILDASLVVAYFNFVNRLVLGLGVALEEDRGEGYKYD